jgi:tetratricopeptide (TPR) repeat protein
VNDVTLRMTLAAAVLCAALAISTDGRAEPPAATAPAEVEAARAKFEAGADAYREERYQEAIDSFRAADAIAPRAALSFNIARAYDKLGDVPHALEYYRQYLERDPNGVTAAETRARIAELEAAVKPAEPAPPEPLAPAPKPAAAQPNPPAQPIALAPTPAPARDDRWKLGPYGVWPWVVLSAGGAALVTSFGFELARRSAEDDAESASHASFQDRYDTMERRKVTARVFAGAGSALLVAGGVLVYLDQRARHEVALDCGPLRCAARWEHRF